MKKEKLAKLERDIYVCESVYLRTTQEFGNMIRGWDKHRFLNKNTYLRTEKLQDKFLENQRIFSKSSVTSLQFTSRKYLQSSIEFFFGFYLFLYFHRNETKAKQTE